MLARRHVFKSGPAEVRSNAEGGWGGGGGTIFLKGVRASRISP